MKPSSPPLTPPPTQIAPPASLDMHPGKAEVASDAETEGVEDGEMHDLDLEAGGQRGDFSKPVNRGGGDREGGVTMGVVSVSSGEESRAGESGVCCGEGRVWIFLVLGLMMLVFCGAVVGVYMTVRTLTTSLEELEVMPTYVPVAAVSEDALSPRI